jgi:outer membrane protein OmpA-like peptidoglycan-associated protein
MLRTFSVGEHTVQVEAGPRALLALVIRGQAPDAVLRRQQDTLETIHLQFASQLADFSGDTAPFLPAQPLLEGCLATVLSTTRAGGSHRLAWLRWALPLLLITAIGAGLWIRSVVRWHRALATLRAEPGLVITEASRGWRRWEISGLRDPDARGAAAVLASAGVPTPALTGRWAAYLSLDPAMVAVRARQAADSVRQAIEHERVLFAAGSADLDATAIAQLTILTTRLERMPGARLEIIGRTDPSGADETNAALARRRVDGVAQWLGAHGIDRAQLVPTPLAARDPLAAGDSATRARINRSVTFRVARPAPSTPGGP